MNPPCIVARGWLDHSIPVLFHVARWIAISFSRNNLLEGFHKYWRVHSEMGDWCPLPVGLAPTMPIRGSPSGCCMHHGWWLWWCAQFLVPLYLAGRRGLGSHVGCGRIPSGRIVWCRVSGVLRWTVCQWVSWAECISNPFTSCPHWQTWWTRWLGTWCFCLEMG